VISAQRKLEPDKLTKAVRGELDWIVMKALEKDRNRRYETASVLALDLQCHLNNEPVLAAPPTARYRANKFVRKHWRGVAVGAGFVLLLALATATSLVLAARANRERQRYEETDKELFQLHVFLENRVLGSVASPNGLEQGLGPDVTVRQAIARAEIGLSKTLRNSPFAEARIRQIFGMTYFRLGEYTNAILQVERTRQLWNSHSTWRSPLEFNLLMTPLRLSYERLGRTNEAEALQAEIAAKYSQLSRKEKTTITRAFTQVAEDLMRAADPQRSQSP
jgi:eukaryotic-like serine/threonine-protein kinase